MKIYTKTGDKGLTSLIGGNRVPKSHIRIESYGTVDELNAYLGLIADQDIQLQDKKVLQHIQNNLFVIGALLAAEPGKSRMTIPNLTDSDIGVLEHEMDAIEIQLPELKHFILPGGSNAISFCHVARCVCRRAERVVVQLATESVVDEKIVIYLNRLSDYLFMLARKVGHDQQIPENKWEPGV
ncbi:cob(I)yrinic acid a,c-diamide adenosyltransferase [Mucilaginibacter sp. PAMB04274]|uniref:cob(I)yrinic acid a,c-diamide adenosyltransferase n=1 Tax=Mucilaginibacter sp. PAMB04274 TaxID=3138568 RepID=UPI0031F65513